MNNVTIDQKELGKFDKTSNEWWDKSGEFKILHDINPVRLKYITDKIAKHFNIKESNTDFLKGLNVIDVGCGGGLISIPIAKLGANVTALDANENNIKSLKDFTKKKHLDIKFESQPIEDHNNSYDVVLCLEVIEHVLNPKEFIKNLMRLTKSGGMIILSTINRTGKSYFQAILIAEYILKWMPVNTHDHSKFVKPSELKNMISGSNFCLKELTGLKLNPITKTWYLSDNIDVNYFAYIRPGTKDVGSNNGFGAFIQGNL